MEPLISLEVELKLTADSSDLTALRSALAAIACGAPLDRRSLVSTYFDTPELALRAAAASLRVRAENGQFVQTLKTAGLAPANLLERGEWQDIVAKNQVDPQAPQSGARLPAGVAGELYPLFVTTITRETVELEPAPGTRIEVAIDLGEIRTVSGGASEPVCELELELKAGPRTALYDLALQLLEAAPLTIGTRSKSERGYALVEGGAAAAAMPAAAVDFAPGTSVETVLQRVGRSCLAQLLRNEPAALAGEPEAVHRMRVELRRLRSMLAAVKGVLPREPRRRVAAELTALAEPLGRARNLDVFIAELLAPLQCDRAGDPGWDELAAAAAAARRAAHHRVACEIRSPQRTARLLRLLRWFDGCEWRAAETPAAPALTAPIDTIAPGILDRCRRKVRRRSRHFMRLTPDQRHRLRIAVKELRYAIELWRSLYPGRELRRYLERMKPVQDELGHVSDIRAAYGLVIELGRTAEQPQPIVAAGGRLLERHERALLRSEARLRRRLRRLNHARRFWRI
ncbi:MAG TPA: CYTH and CHAD domain-containing protein [Stellaceae bacterium]|nr:CYTH and CHAD domain-containing protein [Stellaceae bacterium]